MELIDQVASIGTARRAFSELFSVLRTHQYKPEAVELTTLQRCQRQMIERAIEGGAIGGVMVHHALKLPAMAYLSFVRIPLAAGAGLACAYYSSQTVAPSCLTALMIQNSPLAGEAMSILHRAAPASSMLRRACEAHGVTPQALEESWPSNIRRISSFQAVGSMGAGGSFSAVGSMGPQEHQTVHQPAGNYSSSDHSHFTDDFATMGTNNDDDMGGGASEILSDSMFEFELEDAMEEAGGARKRRLPRLSVHERMVSERKEAARATAEKGEGKGRGRQILNHYGDAWAE